MNQNELIINLQFQLDSEKKTNLEYNIMINEQQNEISKLKNKIEFLENEINKLQVLTSPKVKISVQSSSLETPNMVEETLFKKVSNWIYRT